MLETHWLFGYSFDKYFGSVDIDVQDSSDSATLQHRIDSLVSAQNRMEISVLSNATSVEKSVRILNNEESISFVFPTDEAA